MIANCLLRLRYKNEAGRHIEYAIDEVVLRHEIVHTDSIDPQTEIWLDDQWQPLTAHPRRPWLHALGRELLQAMQSNNLERADYFADKIIRFCADNRWVAVRLARFWQGHVHLCQERYPQAAELLAQAAQGRASFCIAALNNCGVAYALLLNPAAALHALRAAADCDRSHPIVQLNLRNLTSALAGEHAPRLDGEPEWHELSGRAATELHRLGRTSVPALLKPTHPFPSYHWYKILPRQVR